MTTEPPDRAEVSEAPTYQGSRFPWWLTLLWLAFAAFAVIYSMIYYLPDLKAWLAG
jgi:hypothetical protein